jgi:IS5 family transposase
VVQPVGPGAEELLYEPPAVRRFVGLDLGIASAPDETTVLRFHHLLEKHDLGGLMLDAVNVHLEARGIKIPTGTVVDATIIHAPSSTKNASGELPEMRPDQQGQAVVLRVEGAHRCGCERRRGAYAGDHVRQRSRFDVLPDLLHGEERKVWGDGGYQARPRRSSKLPRRGRT